MIGIKIYYDNSMIWTEKYGSFYDSIAYMIDVILTKIEEAKKWSSEIDHAFKTVWKSCMYLADQVKDEELRSFTRKKYKEVLNDIWKEGQKKQVNEKTDIFNLYEPEKSNLLAKRKELKEKI